MKAWSFVWIVLLPAALGISLLKGAALEEEAKAKQAWQREIDAEKKELQVHLAAWKTTTGKQRNEEAEQTLAFAWRTQNFDILENVLADGRLAESEVKTPEETRTVTVTSKFDVPMDRHNRDPLPVWRRITEDRFEIWSPGKGLLFDAEGNLLHTAEPTRDHSQGREWYGAFLPDGHWLTTELHEGDGRVYIFDRKGHCRHEIKAGALEKPGPYRVSTAVMRRVSWARSNRTGDAWVVRTPVGEDGDFTGWADALLKPDGTWSIIGPSSSVWRHCLARQLGVRNDGGVAFYKVESDDGKWVLLSGQPAHGPGSGNPTYQIEPFTSKQEDDEPWSIANIPGEGDGFGFWPKSRATFILGERRTWFFDAARHYQGWISGEPVGDARKGGGMLFRLWDGRCAAVSPTLKVERVQKFALLDGSPLLPVELWPDVGLGIFVVPGAISDSYHPERKPDARLLLEYARGLVLGRWTETVEKKTKRTVGR